MDDFTTFISQLTRKLRGPLPGKAAHRKMISPARKSLYRDADLSDARPSSVLLPFYPVDGRPVLAFVRRQQYDGVHSGQIAFPGGQFEAQDKDLQHTALREAWEETGITSQDVTVIGKLTQVYIPPSNFLVQPFVGYLSKRPLFRPDAGEISEVIEISLEELLTEECLQTKTVTAGRSSYEVPCFYVRQRIIWGATAMMLNELLELIRQ